MYANQPTPLLTLSPDEQKTVKSESTLHSRVLIVEDVAPERLRLAAMLRKQGYEVIEAENGEAALALLGIESVGLVISDWRMPVMDGMALLQEVATRFDPTPYFILLTGQDQMCDLVAAMDAGADDFIRKPFNAEELRTRLQAGARIVRLREQLQQQNQQMFLSLQREYRLNQNLQDDLKAAAQLQRTTLPSPDLALPGVQLAHHFLPASGVAGDTYNLMPLGDHHIAFYHIDAAGHGVRAALLSFALSRFLSDSAARSIMLAAKDGKTAITPPDQVVAELSRRFLDDPQCRNYFTMIYGVLDLNTGQGQLCQAGHPHPLLLSAEGDVSVLGEGGLPVGVLQEATYDNTPFHLNAGDTLLLYSDGLQSCALPSGRALNTPTLCQLLRGRSHKSIGAHHQFLTQLVNKLLKGQSPEDDISFLWLQHHNSPSATTPA